MNLSILGMTFFWCHLNHFWIMDFPRRKCVELALAFLPLCIVGMIVEYGSLEAEIQWCKNELHKLNRKRKRTQETLEMFENMRAAEEMIRDWQKYFFDDNSLTGKIIILDGCDPKAKYVRIQEDRLREKGIIVLAEQMKGFFSVCRDDDSFTWEEAAYGCKCHAKHGVFFVRGKSRVVIKRMWLNFDFFNFQIPKHAVENIGVSMTDESVYGHIDCSVIGIATKKRWEIFREGLDLLFPTDCMVV